MRRTVAVCLGAILLSGCGVGDEPPRKPIDIAALERQEAKRAKQKRIDRRRERSLERFYDKAGLTDRYLMRLIEVDAGSVTVKTDLYPKASNDGRFTGACNFLVDFARWIKRVSVEGSDETEHASWSKGDLTCRTSWAG